MSSILTNNGAMVALQTLRGINSSLADTQNSIATGKDVSTAKDNAATWAISKVMESDVSGFKAISDNLGLGQATTSVARQAAETTTDLLKEMKEKIVSAQESNVDRTKIQADIAALRDQITSVTGAAQFNGLNLLSNTEAGANAAGTGEVDVLSSLDRSSGGVAAANITVAKQDLGTGASTAGTVSVDGGVAVTVADGAGPTAITNTTLVTATSSGSTAGITYSVDTSAFEDSAGAIAAFAGLDVSYVARDGDTLADINGELAARLNVQMAEADYDVSFSVDGNGQLAVTNNSGDDFVVADAGDIQNGAAGEDDGIVGGGLELLGEIDVTTDAGSAGALAAIEGLIQTAIDSASSFGSSEGRIETQQDFVSGLMDAMKSGIGTLVDADMEEQSARLQALQVQQQLGVQALSIANQAPQQLLSLFR